MQERASAGGCKGMRTQRCESMREEGIRVGGHKDTRSQGWEGTMVGGHKGARVGGHKDTRVGGHKGGRVQRHKDRRVQGHQGTRMGGCKGTGVGSEGARAVLTSFSFPTTFQCKKFKQVPLRHVVLRCPHHLKVQSPTHLHSQNSKRPS